MLAAVVAALTTSSSARADTLEIGAAADATLYANDGTLADGGGQYFFAGLNNNAQERRAVLSFDVASALPAGATVTGVEFVLALSRTSPGDTTIAVHHVTAAWGEAGSVASGEEGGGTAAMTGDATWAYRLYDSAEWSTPGGDFDATVLASTSVGGLGTYSWSSAALIADVQGWLDTPSGNFGWILLGDGVGTSKRFDSHENGTTAQRPKLVVTFTPPAQATGACCAADGGCALVLDASASTACASGSYQGASSACTPNPCPQPAGACCLPDAAGSCMALGEAACAGQSGAFNGAGSACADVICPAVLPPFVDPLPIPHIAQPQSGSEGGEAQYTLTMKEMAVKVHRDLPPTRMWGFDDGVQASSPGPVIEAFKDQPVTVTWANDLRDLATGVPRGEHVLTVETCVHGAQLGPPKTVIHLHGGHTPARFDGFPEDDYPPGESATYVYPNHQLATTLWYHDHALGVTRLDMYMGLAGMYVLRDADEEALALPAGKHEIPLVIQDRSFRGDGSLIYPDTFQEMFFGNTLLVNGKAWPYLNVDQGKYRFRVLNASNGRTLRLSLDDGASFQVVASDGGMLAAPVTATSITLGAAERAELVIDFSGYAPGTEVVLENDAPAPFPGTPGVGVVPNVMKFVVGSTSGDTTAVPASLVPVPKIPESDSVRSRDFFLRVGNELACGQRMWMINDRGWHDITEYPRLGTTEIWRFINASGMAHPMHVHLVQFQVLDRQSVRVQGEQVTALAAATPPAPEEAGWKDTVMVEPGEAVRVIATFTDYVGSFVYHCHIAEHEDQEMMRQFVTTTECGDGVVGEPDESCDDGNDDTADSCPDGRHGTCQPAACGDGLVWSEDGGHEQCDDGGETASCDADCTLVQCGDGTVNASAGEQCDDGGESASCNADCTKARCGDGTVNTSAGEACDDAGESERCNADCTLARCGDGLINRAAGERCDDGEAGGDRERCAHGCQDAQGGSADAGSADAGPPEPDAGRDSSLQPEPAHDDGGDSGCGCRVIGHRAPKAALGFGLWLGLCAARYRTRRRARARQRGRRTSP